jgi:transcriptional regulator with XRE-family HTH domain
MCIVKRFIPKNYSYQGIIMCMKEPLPDNNFGINLRRIRLNKGYTQTKLAELSGVSQRIIEHYEKYAKRPSIDKVKKLAATLGVTDEEILGVSKRKTSDDSATFKIMKKVRVVEKMPKRDQDMVFGLINTLVEKNKLKEQK